MTNLILPDHVAKERQLAVIAEVDRAEQAAAEQAQMLFALWLRRAFGEGFELALKTPARLRGQVNLDATFEAWYLANAEAEARE